ncbi:MAG: cytochrome c biogenesis protein CcdA [Nitrospiraceae bacterium]|nr:cytochrome c biogenesis protein CcdA [Nitrospiraceae bacterium]
MKDVSVSFAFIAGLLSFLSPCVLPLLPSYISFITGISFEELTADADKKRIRTLTIKHSLLFIAGFSLIFILLGASSSYLGRVLFEYKDWIRIVGGVVIIIFGLSISGILNISLLMREKKIHLSSKPAGYLGTVIVGMTFATGWTPCIGPILGTILIYAGSKASMLEGIKLLAIYSAGLALPFLAASLAINSFLNYSKKLQRYLRFVMTAGGVILILFGILLVTDQLRIIAALVPSLEISSF